MTVRSASCIKVKVETGVVSILYWRENMDIFSFLKGKKDKKVSFFKDNNLQEWWEQNFDQQEKKMIISESSNLLIETNSDKTKARILYLIAGNCITRFHNSYSDAIICLLKKAGEISTEPEERFEIYSQLIKLLHDKEKKEEALDLIREAKRKKWEGSWEQLQEEIN